jgi:DNA-binding LacI/PurR family transcriptional regulator
MTVSRALREGVSVNPEIRARVREAARSLGYQTDARVSDVMTALRKSEVPRHRESLAFIWTHQAAGHAAESSSLNELREGARRRAFLLGYQLEEFHLTDPNCSGRELSELLHSHGIRGVLIALDAGQDNFRLRLNWRQFCCVCVGRSVGMEGLSCIEHDQYFGCVLAARRLKRMRYKRIGLVLSHATDKRTERLIQSAFISFHPLGPEEAKRLIFISDRYCPSQLDKWFRQARPEVILAQFEDSFPKKEQLLNHAASGTSLATLNWSAEDPGIAGVNQHQAHLGEVAINVLLEQLQQANRLGLNPMATSIKIPGSWVAADCTNP